LRRAMSAPCLGDSIERALLQRNFAPLRSGYHNSDRCRELKSRDRMKFAVRELDSTFAW
jgi:hypothetical protein